MHQNPAASPPIFLTFRAGLPADYILILVQSSLHTKHLLARLSKQIRMSLSEHQHRPQSHRSLSTAAHIDSDTLHQLQKLIPSWTIPRDECALAFTAQILDFAGVFLRKAGEKRVEVRTSGGGVRDEGMIGYVGGDGAEEEGAGWVAHPGVELA